MYPKKSNERRATMVGSSCLSEPAAALRGIRESRFSRLLPFFIALTECLEAEEDLPADFDRHVLAQAQRDGLDRADIGGDHFAGSSIAARHCLCEEPVLVNEGDAESIDL